MVGQNAVENNELYSKRETKNGTEFYYDQDDIEFNLLQYQVAKGLLSRDEVPNNIFERLDGTLSLDTGGTTIQDPSKESFSMLFDKEIAANSVITDEEYNKLVSGNPQIVAKIQAETGLDFSASQSNDYGVKTEDIESNASIADSARAVQSFMNDRVTDITDVRDNGDSGGMVVGAALSRPFLRMAEGAINGGAGLVILGVDSDARAETWTGIKTFAEHPIDNTSTALTNYWNNTSWNQMLEDGFVAGYGAGLGGGTKLVSTLDTSPIITVVDVPSKYGQAGQIGITLTPNPKLDVADTTKAVGTGGNKEVISLDVGWVDNYGNQKKVIGDGTIARDHQPSKAALLKRAEDLKGEPLTQAEKNRIINEGMSVTVPNEVHAAGPTYAGKNNKGLIEKDANDLQTAQIRDSKAMIENAKELTPEHVTKLQQACTTLSCKNNADYDNFLKNIMDEEAKKNDK